MVQATEYWPRGRRPGFYNRIIITSLQTKLLSPSRLWHEIVWESSVLRGSRGMWSRKPTASEDQPSSRVIHGPVHGSPDLGEGLPGHCSVMLCAWPWPLGSYPSGPSTGQSHSRGWSERDWTIVCFPELSPSFHSLLSMTRGWEPVFLPEGKPKDRRKKKGFCLLLVVPPMAIALRPQQLWAPAISR